MLQNNVQAFRWDFILLTIKHSCGSYFISGEEHLKIATQDLIYKIMAYYMHKNRYLKNYICQIQTIHFI